jgi:glycosyltransferase involved in cell wall biosynthesis
MNNGICSYSTQNVGNICNRVKGEGFLNSFAILIPTRNRPKELSILLRSIQKLTHLPKQVVVIASGQRVAHILEEFSKSIEITYLHTEVSGQIAQKRLGVELVSNEVEWCLFLDDDLIVEESAIDLALSAASSHKKRDIIGIGLSLPPLSRSLNASKLNKKFLKLFKLSSSYPGKVLRSGHATSYLQETSVTETQWLNGASMWKIEYVKNYGMDLPSTPYAACEDLIFSYPLSKQGTLIYVPESKLRFQESQLSDFDSVEVLRAASFWRYYFISKNHELSFRWFFLTQIIRSLYAIRKAKVKRLDLSLELLRINVKLLRSNFLGVSPKVLLNELNH